MKDLIITEVSSVDRGAGQGVKVMLMKRDRDIGATITREEIDALVAKAVAAVVADAIKASAATQSEHGVQAIVLPPTPNRTHRSETQMTATTLSKAMSLDDYDLPAFIEQSADAGEVTKAELGELLNRRVLQNKRPEESVQQAYARLFADGQDHAGAQVFKRYMAMRGPDEHQIATRKALDEAVPRRTANDTESPMAKLEAMAEDMRQGTTLTKQQAFTKALETPAGMALYKTDKAQRLGTA